MISVKAWQGLTLGYKNFKPPLSWSVAFKDCAIYWTSGFQPKGGDLSKGSEDKFDQIFKKPDKTKKTVDRWGKKKKRKKKAFLFTIFLVKYRIVF